jgi:hypothetical protein
MPVAIDIPDVPGDPAGMRALAAGLRSDAQAIGDVGSSLKSRFDSIDFYGPAADRIEGQTSNVGKVCTDVASGLIEAASLLETWAGRVEARQAAAVRKASELRAQSIRGAR